MLKTKIPDLQLNKLFSQLKKSKAQIFWREYLEGILAALTEVGKTERTGLDYTQSSLSVTLNLQHCLDISLDRNLEFQRKSEDKATDLRVINQWMYGKPSD